MPKIRKILISILIFLTIFSLYLAVFYTNTSLRLTLETVQKFIPGKLEIKGVYGRLTGPFRIELLSYRYKTISIVVKNVQLDWRLSELLRDRAVIKNLYAQDVNVYLPPKSEAEEKAPISSTKFFRRFRFPLALEFRDIRFDRVTVNRQDLIKPIVIYKASFALETTKNWIRLVKLDLHAPNAVIQIYGEFKYGYRINWNIDIKHLGYLIPSATGSLKSNGDISGFGPKLYKANISVQANQIKVGDTKLGYLSSKIDIDFRKLKSYPIFLIARDIYFGQYEISELGLHGKFTTAVVRGKFSARLAMIFYPTTVSVISGYRIHQLTVHTGSLQASFSSNGFFSKLRIVPVQQQPFTAIISLTRYHKTFRGDIKVRTGELGLLPVLFPRLEDTKGVLAADIQFSGSLLRPILSGDINLSNAEARVPTFGLDLKNINAKAQLSFPEVNYFARAESGNGHLTINGKTLLNRRTFPSVIDVKGKNFLASDTASYRIYVSPDLKLLLNTKSLNISGKIVIPSANIQPIDLSSTETLPNDVIFVDKQNQKILIRRAAFPVYIQVELILGDKVNLNIASPKGNLKGRLDGHLEVDYQPKKDTVATGLLSVKDGTYTIFGQELIIRQGNLIFSGGSISNPGLNIEAVRIIKAVSAGSFDVQGRDLTVGINITGFAHNPKTVFFSEPVSLTNEDILSYLILGQPVKQVSANIKNRKNMDLLIQAASMLNFGGSGGLANLKDSFQKKFGLSEFGFATETTLGEEIAGTEAGDILDEEQPSDTVSNTSFVVGKYISPSLYLSYSLGLLGVSNIFRVRYLLSRRWAIQTETSDSGDYGVDLLYNIDKD